MFADKRASNNSASSDAIYDEILIPKNAIDILNELMPGIVIQTELLESSKRFMATLKINESTYVEYGKIEAQTKQAVAETALQDLFFETIKTTMFSDDDSQYNTSSWKLLGSLAMYKLIEHWLKFYMTNNKYKRAFEISMPLKISEPSNNLLADQKQSAKTNKNDVTLKRQNIPFKSVKEEDIKELKNQRKEQQSVTNKNETAESSKKISSQKLPESKILTENINACDILNRLVKSNFKFVDMNENINQPPFSFSVTLDDVQCVGVGGSKKEAKQNVARKILIQKFGYLQVSKGIKIGNIV